MTLPDVANAPPARRGHTRTIRQPCILIAIGLLVSGSATGPDSTADARDEVRCQKYTPTGSHIPQTRCASVEQLEREREAAQEFIKKRTQQTTTGGSN